MRHDFHLREADRDYLDRLGLAWEAVREGNLDWLVIHEWVVPTGYTVSRAKVALQIPSGYPDTQIDMAYFSPPLARADGREIHQAVTRQDIAGESFQRWSRHRTGENPWVPGDDCIETHVVLVKLWLTVELGR